MNIEDALTLYKKHGKDLWHYYAAQGWVESRFREDARSPAGAVGIAQFMKITIDDLAERFNFAFNPLDPDKAIQAQIIYMEWCLKATDQDTRKALAAYNWGYSNLRKCMIKYRNKWIRNIPLETHAYIMQVISIKELFRHLDKEYEMFSMSGK